MSSTNGHVKRLDQRIAIITGGSRGIGRTTAERFAEAGATIILVDVNQEQGEAAAHALEQQGHRACFIKANVTNLEAMEDVARQTYAAYGRIDILVNNAGITRDATLKKMVVEDFEQVINVNLKGVFTGTKAVVPYMIEAGYGRILNAASVVAHYGNFGQTNYVASKAGVIGMTKTWARELGRKGITVNAVAPGFIQTELIDSVPNKVLNMFIEDTPLQRLGTPADIANAYLFLASEEAAFITGTVLNVDGGLVL